jgi:hypothetical protein
VVYRVLADLVVVVHLAFVAFVAVGALLAWRWPRLVRVHLPAVAWAAAIVAIGFTCPLTPLEKALRRRAGGATYEGGFVDHYLTGVLYPGRYLGLARALVLALILVGYAGLALRARSQRGVGGEVETRYDRGAWAARRRLRRIGVGDLDVPETNHVEWEAVVARRFVEGGHPDVLEVHLQEDEPLGARPGHLEQHVVDPRASRARKEQPR